eukprot:1147991-Pelagomonas_calceolata.AAC.1
MAFETFSIRFSLKFRSQTFISFLECATQVQDGAFPVELVQIPCTSLQFSNPLQKPSRQEIFHANISLNSRMFLAGLHTRCSPRMAYIMLTASYRKCV